jgi:hypothetical protein
MTEYLHPSGRATTGNKHADSVSRQLAAQDRPHEDDRYPGSFFRIPGVPAPGKTTWSLVK